MPLYNSIDLDGDGYLNKKDVSGIVKAIVLDLSEAELSKICDSVFEEADIDGDERLSFVEFDHIISRAPDFLK